MRVPATTVNLADVSTFFVSDNANCPITSYSVMTLTADLPANVYGGTDISVLASNQLAVDVSTSMLQSLFLMAKTASGIVNFIPI